jgi:hypothetical protein
MRALSFAACLLISALLASGETPPEKLVSPSVAIFMDFDSQPGVASVQVMEKEVDALLKPSGVTLNWRLARDNDGTETFSGLVVMKFRGQCRVEGWTQPGNDFGTLGETLALGSTQVTDGVVLPFSAVECDQVRKALGYLHPGTTQFDRQKTLGLALARVVAHELYHILARTTSHASAGLAKASQSLQDLVGLREIGFQAADSQAIRDSFH